MNDSGPGSEDRDKIRADLERSCHDCGKEWTVPKDWELNSEPRIYSAPGFIKRVCNSCYSKNRYSARLSYH